jgi:hypothetical protein
MVYPTMCGFRTWRRRKNWTESSPSENNGNPLYVLKFDQACSRRTGELARSCLGQLRRRVSLSRGPVAVLAAPSQALQ